MHWLSILAICVLGAMTPGPSLAVVIKHTVNESKHHGIVVAISHAAGVGAWALLTVWGLASLLAESPIIFQWLTWFGAAYLAYIGFRALMSGGCGQLAFTETTALSLWRSALDGLLISLLNPKLALFFIALFSQFVSYADSVAAKLIMTMTAAGVDGLWYVLVATLLSRSSVLTKLQQHSKWMDRISGGIFILLAIRVVTI